MMMNGSLSLTTEYGVISANTNTGRPVTILVMLVVPWWFLHTGCETSHTLCLHSATTIIINFLHPIRTSNVHRY